MKKLIYSISVGLHKKISPSACKKFIAGSRASYGIHKGKIKKFARRAVSREIIAKPIVKIREKSGGVFI